jgi:hypothetical protein
MARKRKLRPGKGAKAIILTRFIKPNQPLPDNNRDHRSNLVLVERVKDAKAKDIYKFRYDIDAEEEAGNFLSANVHHVLSANVRYVKVTMEGDSNDLFDGPGEPLPEPFKEPKKKWRNSRARRLLYDDVKNGVVQFGGNNNKPVMALEDIYSMHPEYVEYDECKFGDRLNGIITIVKKMENRAEEDYEAFLQYMENYPVSYANWKGYIQWQGSESRRLALIDLEANQEIALGYRQLYERRPEYYNEFPFDVFRDKCRQEIQTKKYIHTLKVKGKQHPSS